MKTFVTVLQLFKQNMQQNVKMQIPSFLDAIASHSTYPSQWVGQSVSQWVMFSDFGDSYRIYRACELAISKLYSVSSSRDFLEFKDARDRVFDNA